MVAGCGETGFAGSGLTCACARSGTAFFANVPFADGEPARSIDSFANFRFSALAIPCG